MASYISKAAGFAYNKAVASIPVVGSAITAYQEYGQKVEGLNERKNRVNAIQRDLQKKINSGVSVSGNKVRKFKAEELGSMSQTVAAAKASSKKVDNEIEKAKTNAIIKGTKGTVKTAMNMVVPGSGFVAGGVVKVATAINEKVNEEPKEGENSTSWTSFVAKTAVAAGSAIGYGYAMKQSKYAYQGAMQLGSAAWSWLNG
jgi:hypothetical protein